MKIILSRKGFDSVFGGVPSPIFPDGKMISLPIPNERSPILYQDIKIKWNRYYLGEIVSELTNGVISSSYKAHLDPDINPLSLSRDEKWRPIFGQVKAAQGHLRKQQVQPGDIFIFFGLFRKVVINNSRLKYDSNDSPKHIIWGWLQIDNIVTVDYCDKEKLKWALYHPHFYFGPDITNTLYIAMNNLSIPGFECNHIKGAGTFETYHPHLQLTKFKSDKVSLWQLPEWFHPTNDKIPLTYHADLKRWNKHNGLVLLNTVARGQEFVLDCSHYPEAKAWVMEILSLRC